MFDVTKATTAELVAKYNDLTPHATIKKFSDRKTAERRVTQLLTDQIVLGLYGQTHCPACGVHLENGVQTHEALRAERLEGLERFQFLCMACDEEFGPEIEGATAADPVRSAAIAKSWQNEQVKKARSTRHFVRVDGVEFRSVRAAFIGLNLPLNEHIKFRSELKAAVKLNAYNKRWEALEM